MISTCARLCCAAVLICSAVAASPIADGYELELVQVLFRHGERTPQKDEAGLMGNSNISLHEPWGFAQLTNKGKMQEFTIGVMLRTLYDDFLGSDFKPEYVYACSSGFDRTKASLELVLAALYPPSEALTWNQDLKWLPIPINSLPWSLDNLFNSDSCPVYKANYKKLMNTREIRNKLKLYDESFKVLNKAYPNATIDLRSLFLMNNLLSMMLANKVEMPDWYNPELHENIRAAALFYLDSLSYTPSLIRMNGGPMTRRFAENMDPLGWHHNPRKIYLYGGHEFTVYAVAKAHNVTLPKSPAFGSALILEKLRDKQGELFVRMLYWTGVSEELIEVKLDNCDEYCPIRDYLKIVKPSFPSDDDRLCLYKNLKPTDFEKLLTTDVTAISS